MRTYGIHVVVHGINWLAGRTERKHKGDAGEDLSAHLLSEKFEFQEVESDQPRIYDAFYGSVCIRLNKTDQGYTVINGYHRLFVAKELGLETVPAQVVEPQTE